MLSRYVLQQDDEPASSLAFTVVDSQEYFDDDAGSGISWSVSLASLLLVTSCCCRDVLRRQISNSCFFQWTGFSRMDVILYHSISTPFGASRPLVSVPDVAGTTRDCPALLRNAEHHGYWAFHTDTTTSFRVLAVAETLTAVSVTVSVVALTPFSRACRRSSAG